MFDFLKRKKSAEPGAAVPHDESEESNDLFLWIVTLGLLVFTGWRSLHLISDTLPDEAKVMAFGALLALDAGALCWLAFANSVTDKRHGLALLMVAVDLAGVGATAIADTALISGVNPDLVETVALWVVPVIVIANVAATFAAKAMSPARKAREAESMRLARIKYERRSALDEIESAEREAELSMLRNRAAFMRQRSAARYSLSDDVDVEPGENGRRREMAADGAEFPAPKGRKAKN